MSEETTTEATTEATVNDNTSTDAPAVEAEGTLLSTEANVEPEKVVPDSYEAFTMPEGIELNDSVLSDFNTMAKELKLSQSEAQNLVDIGNKSVQTFVDSQRDAFTEMRGEWVNELKQDQEFGGAKFSETVERAKRSLTKFGDEGLIKTLDESGYGDNPHVIKMLAKIDKAFGEDISVGGKPVNNSNKSAASIIYPSAN